jgi:hypothetical protein
MGTGLTHVILFISGKISQQPIKNSRSEMNWGVLNCVMHIFMSV